MSTTEETTTEDAPIPEPEQLPDAVDAERLNTSRPSYQVVGSTYTTTTTNYTLSLFYGRSPVKTNVNVSLSGGGLA